MRGSRSKALHDQALVNCQYSMATFSTGERKRRPHGDRKSSEMTLHLKQTFDAAILTQLYPRSQIDIYVQVRRAPVTVAGARAHTHTAQGWVPEHQGLPAGGDLWVSDGGPIQERWPLGISGVCELGLRVDKRGSLPSNGIKQEGIS